MKPILFFISIILSLPMLALSQQKDTLIVKDTTGKVVASSKVKKSGWMYKYDSTGKRIYSPKTAAIMSAILPGLGQTYNRKYWKVPIVWTAVGIPIYTYFDNRNWYHKIQYAITVLEAGQENPPPANYQDMLEQVDPKLQYFVVNNKESSLTNYRNEYRKNMDYSILFTLLFWGLNVVDATVDAHLKGFNVNDNLTMQIKPAILSPQSIGLSLVFKFADR
ncbi:MULTISPECIES: DUF5683 domain-containing protein [Niastella]|uniref:DUF5683 domain-containing protein n=1 Tax=Niastella soli TaxID=2821487 RepID=A0ABS3YZX8_9BACT|nr:DUF5683 domain-containing protein [Niastella soli]MBO9203448.1 hypothetical protein [Niastella soli]